MEPVSAVASVISIYQLAAAISGLCFRYGQGVRQADKDADLIISEIDTFQIYLRTLKEVLVKEDAATDGLERLQSLHHIIDGESAVLQKCGRELEILKTKLEKVQSEGRFQGAIHKLSWPLKREEVKKALDTLKKFTEAVDRALNVDNNRILRRIDSTTKSIQGSLESAEAQEIKQKILDWLAYPDPSEIHEIVRSARNDQAKTGKWFLHGTAFEKFKATSGSILWLHGDSGCGKSVLCSAVIDEILAVKRIDSRVKLTYWYFTVTDKKRTSVANYLRALIAQLVLECPVPSSLLELWSARKTGREAPKTADLEQTIRRILVGEPSHIYYVVIDALDESDDTEEARIMQFVRSLALLEADIHVLFTSRTNTVGIEKGMKDLTNFYNVAMKPQDTDLDIIAHLSERLEDDSALTKWSHELRQYVKDTLIRDAGGMFRWVECQLQAVRRCRKPAEVRKVLKTLPRDLYEVYARDLARVDDSASEDVIRLLEWLAFPQRRLWLDEAVDMLAVDMESDPPAFNEENRMIDSEEILKICGSLIRLDTIAESQDGVRDSASGKALAVSHTSVIDFLTTHSVRIGSKQIGNFSRARANLRMAETCLIYLRHFSGNDIILTKDLTASHPFVLFCAYWDSFYREVYGSSEQVDMARLNGLVMELFSSPVATLNWLKIFNPDGALLSRLKLIYPNDASEGLDFDAELSHIKPAIYYAVRAGLPDIILSLIRAGSKIDELVGPPFGTPLVAASANGATEVVSLLLSNGADPNLSGYFYYGTPLAAAIEFGGHQTVKILLGREGIDINGKRHPPLEATNDILEKVNEYRELRATARDHEKLPGNKERRRRCIKIGLELIQCAEITEDWGNGFRETSRGSGEINEAYSEEESDHLTQGVGIVSRRYLDCLDDLDKNDYLESFFDRADTALQKIEWSNQNMVEIAAEDGLLDILEMLLAAGADPNSRGGFYGTTLQKACAHDGDEAVVKMLLKNGARTDIYGGFYGSPLMAACRRGSFQKVELLVKASADVNRLDPRWISPLFQACESNQVDVVNLLLKYGAKPDIGGDGEDTPLLAASKARSTELVKVLLDAGNDINWNREMKGTALYVASENRDTEMVRLLLARDADPNIQQCGRYDHALQAACVNGCEEIVDLLLQRQAKTNLVGGIFDNALQAACVAGNITIALMLLLHGADATRIGGAFGNTMYAAVDGKNKAIVDLLLDLGVSINECRGSVTYPLLHALNLEPWDGQDSFVYHLLVRGADPNLELGDDLEIQHTRVTRRTALQFAESTFLTATLLDHGAQINTIVKGCITALIDAILWKSEYVVRTLIDHGADVNLSTGSFGSPLVTACTKGRLDVVKLLIEKGADLHATNLTGHSALLTAALSVESKLDLFEFMIRQGLDPLQEDERGCNCLHYATRAQKGDYIKWMLEHGFNVNVTDNNGWSSLHWAVASTEDSAAVVNLLLERGSDKSMQDRQGRTAFDIAKIFKRTEDIAMLANHAQTDNESSYPDEPLVQPRRGDWTCDGCGVEGRYCKPESRYRCDDCFDFDFCFRCILDKDAIHLKDHSFSIQPA